MNKNLMLAICDDEEISLVCLKGALQAFYENKNLSVAIDLFQSVKKMEQSLLVKNYDLIFLDINIQKDDGIKFAKNLRNEYPKIPIVFVSNQEERVFEAITVSPLAFIRKDKFISDLQEFMKRFEDIYNEMQKQQKTLLVQIQNQGLYKVPVEQVICFEGYMHNQIMYEIGESEPKIIVSKLKDLENELEKDGFVRIQRGYLVNMKHVIKLEKSQLVLSNNMQIPIARSNVQNVKSILFEYNMK